jgi:hypothetical protein
MKKNLIAFTAGMIAIMLVVFVFWILLVLVGQDSRYDRGRIADDCGVGCWYVY